MIYIRGCLIALRHHYCTKGLYFVHFLLINLHSLFNCVTFAADFNQSKVKMKKTILNLMAFAAASSALAGGLLTNTNQNAAFNRNFAQEGKIDITSIYANPAGGAFLAPGWHLSLNNQTAFQRRTIDTTFPLFQQNRDNPEQTHSFVGKATAPAIPSFTASYNREKWSVSAHFALTGGGGKCEFDRGLGSFEAIAAAIPSAVTTGIAGQLMANGYPQPTASAMAQQVGPDSYSMNSSMKGNSYYFGLQLGGTYKFTDNISGYVGIRGIYATCSYEGFVGDFKLYNSQTGAQALPSTMMGGAPYTALVSASYGGADPTITLNCDQTGFGVTPIVGFDWKMNDNWNFVAKYEFKTKMRLENKSEMNDYTASVAEQNATLGQFKDGTKIAADIPAIASAGVQFSPIEVLRINAGFHYYFDKEATQYGDKQDRIDDNTWEMSAGAEFDCGKRLTLSAGWQRSKYGLSDAYMNDLSFTTSNNSIGLGARILVTERLNIDFGYMQTFYDSREVSVKLSEIITKTDKYERTNRVFGLGVNLKF